MRVCAYVHMCICSHRYVCAYLIHPTFIQATLKKITKIPIHKLMSSGPLHVDISLSKTTICHSYVTTRLCQIYVNFVLKHIHSDRIVLVLMY